MITELHIETAYKAGRTYLKKAFCLPPLKVADITEDKKDKVLQLMLMSSSPGILDGDEYRMKIELAEDCSLQLHTQSFQRLFTMKQGATQHLVVTMAKGASFCFLPHPVVPHKDSSFTAIQDIHLKDQCSLIWGEVLTCGRKLNGEVFLFSKYHVVTRIFIQDKLVIKENMLILPAITDVNAPGQWEGFTHQGSLIYLREAVSVKQITSYISSYLSNESDIAFGITAAPVSGVIVRLLGHRAEQLHTCMKTIAKYLSGIHQAPPQQNEMGPSMRVSYAD